MVANKFIQAGKVRDIKGSILTPESAGLRFIVVPVSQSGKWESELQLKVSKRWLKVREDYKTWHATQNNFKLGQILTTAVSSDTWTIQLLVNDKEEKTDLKLLALAVKKLGELARAEKASVHLDKNVLVEMPELVDLLKDQLTDTGVNLYLYSEDQK